MSKNILIITGSPRKGGNSNRLADSFMKGARAAGHEVTTFSSAETPVAPCIACNACWKKGKACSLDDTFDTLSSLLEKSDVLVLCSPLYWFTFSAQLKAALDKCYAFTVPHCKKRLKVTATVLLMSAGDPDEAAFTGAVSTYKAIGDYLNLADRGVILAPGVQERGEITATDALERAEKLGREI